MQSWIFERSAELFERSSTDGDSVIYWLLRTALLIVSGLFADFVAKVAPSYVPRVPSDDSTLIYHMGVVPD